MRGLALNGVDRVRLRQLGRAVAMAVFALLMMLSVVLTSPPQPVQSHSVGIGHEVTDTVTTQSQEPAGTAGNADTPKQVTIAIGALAMAVVVGLAFSRRTTTHRSRRP